MNAPINQLTEQIIGAAIDVKTADAILDIHEAQVLTYLKFTGCHIGLLFNFRATMLMKTGFRRLAL